MPKKFLDQNGLEYFARKFNDYPDNELLGTVINAIGEELEGKSDTNHTHTSAQVEGATTPQANYLVKYDNSAYVQSTTPNVGDNSAKVATTAFVSTAISSAIGNISGFNISVVQTLPVSGDSGTFYFVSNSGTGNNIYDEYVYVNSAWEKIGSLDTGNIDLDGYLKTTDIASWAKATNKPSYTASEVGAMSSSHAAAAITAQDITNWNNKPNTDTNTTYSLSISNNRITLTPSSGTATYVDLPVYDGSVT